MFLKELARAFSLTVLVGGLICTCCSSESQPRQALQAQLFKNPAAPVEVFSGDSIATGDKLYMTVTTALPLRVYVVSEDFEGERWIIHPCRNWGLSRPLSPGRLHRLPLPVLGQQGFWPIQSVTPHERLLVLASSRPLEELESKVVAEVGRQPCAVALESRENRFVDRLTDGHKPTGPQRGSCGRTWKYKDGDLEVWISAFDLKGKASYVQRP